MKYYLFDKQHKELIELTVDKYAMMYVEMGFSESDGSDCLVRYYPTTKTIMSDGKIDGYWFHCMEDCLHEYVSTSWDSAYAHFENLGYMGSLSGLGYEISKSVCEGKWTKHSFYGYGAYFANEIMNDILQPFTPHYI